MPPALEDERKGVSNGKENMQAREDQGRDLPQESKGEEVGRHAENVSTYPDKARDSLHVRHQVRQAVPVPERLGNNGKASV